MTKSPNTKNEQQTEQWKKGELPSGWYYVQLQEGVYADNVKSIIMDYYTDFCDFMKHPYLIEQVLAPVPSYEEYKDLKSKLQLKDTAYDFDTDRLEEENAQLKELLKDCFEYIDWTDGTGSPISQQKLLDKINEALR